MGDDSTGGQRAPEELEDIHIHELRAALFALKCFEKSIISGKHVKIMIDSTTAVAAISGLQATVIKPMTWPLTFGSFV